MDKEFTSRQTHVSLEELLVADGDISFNRLILKKNHLVFDDCLLLLKWQKGTLSLVFICLRCSVYVENTTPTCASSPNKPTPLFKKYTTDNTFD